MGGETFGLLLMRSREDFVRFVRLGDEVSSGRRRHPGPGVPLLSFNFDRPRDLPGGKKLAAEARAHGFVPGPSGRVPYILNATPDAVPMPPSTEDYRLATACLEAVILAWLSASGRGNATRLAAARQRVGQCRDAFLKEASDPRRFGVAKAMVQAMGAANVDPDDAAAVDSFVRDFNRRLADDPSLLPSFPRPGKAWAWNGEGPPPVDDGKGHTYPLPLHHGAKTELSDIYVRGLCRALEIDYQELRKKL